MGCCNSVVKPREQRVLFLGPPCSGKGTLSTRYAKSAGIPHHAMGDILRAEIKKGTKVGKEVEPLLREGKLVKQSLLSAILKSKNLSNDGRSSFVLDGYPRLPESCDTMKADLGTPTAIVNLTLSDDLILARMAIRRLDPETGNIYSVSGNIPPDVEARLVTRSDDTKRVMSKRISTFKAHNTKIQKKLRSIFSEEIRAGTLRVVDVDTTSSNIDEISRAIKEALSKEVGNPIGKEEGAKNSNPGAPLTKPPPKKMESVKSGFVKTTGAPRERKAAARMSREEIPIGLGSG